MRKFVRLFAAAALLVRRSHVRRPAGRCRRRHGRASRVAGSATFTPPLPEPREHEEGQGRAEEQRHGRAAAAVRVKSGKITGVSPKSTGSNCTTLATRTKTPTKVTLTVKWNTGAASTVAAQLKEIPKVAGHDADGRRARSRPVSSRARSCRASSRTRCRRTAAARATPLAKVTYKDVGAVVIK